MYACREQSQKDILNILKSVRFFYRIPITFFFTLVHSEEFELFHYVSDLGEEMSGYRSEACRDPVTCFADFPAKGVKMSVKTSTLHSVTY
jgi:hypothetical protein